MNAVLSSAVVQRAKELDALDAILPFDRRDQLAALLTDDDVATLKHLATEGMGDNTIGRWPLISATSKPGVRCHRQSPCPGRRPKACS